MDVKLMLDHLLRYRVEAVEVDGTSGTVLLDTSGDPIIATALLFDEDGLPVAGRLRIVRDDLAHYPDSIQGYMQQNLGKLSETMPLSEVLDYFGLRGKPSGFAEDVAVGFMVTPGGQGADKQSVVDAAGAWLNSKGVLSLSSRLDPEVMKVLACAHHFKRASYAFYAKDGEVGRYRRQAGSAYPLLAVEISSKLSVKMAVDRNKPLQEVLMRAFGVDDVGNPRLSKPLLKRLATKQLPDGGIPVQVIINALSEIPPDWFPKSDEEWSTFLDLTDTFFRRLGPELGLKVGDMAVGSSGKWGDFAKRLATAYVWTQAPGDLTEEEKKAWKPVIDTSRAAMGEAVENTKDVIQAFRNLVVLPLAANAGNGVPVFVGPEQLRMASDVAASIIYGNQSMKDVLSLQRHWHTQAHNIENAAGNARHGELKVVSDDGWPPLCDVIMAPNGVEIVPLTDERELKNEGALGLGKDGRGIPGPDADGIMGLGHCVGGYAGRCKAGTAHIVSFRIPLPDGTFKRLSTAEFGRLHADSTELSVVQHHGERNGSAPQEAREAFDWFVKSVRDGQIPLNYDGVMVYLSAKRNRAEEVETYSGYDWRDMDAINEAIDPWRPYLPRRLRGLDVEALRELPELADLSQAIAPNFGYAGRMR